MEELLHKLIEKGWRIENPNARISDVKYMHWLRELRIVYETDLRDAVREYPIRFLVSKESWLWQFVCENRMRPKRVWYEEHYWQRDNHTNWRWMVMESEPEYRIIESSLKDESELEDFLLSKIKVDEKDNM